MSDMQVERFQRLRQQFAAQLAAVRPLDDPRLVRNDWSERNRELAASLLPVPPHDFLRHPVILYQMFVNEDYLSDEAPYVLSRLPDVALAREDPVGDPLHRQPIDATVITSSNTVHHLHHLLRYEEAAGRRIADFHTVFEWGGGYGNLAKLLIRLHGAFPTYVLLDTPVFAAVQWLYLASVFGEDRVVLHTAPTTMTPGIVNIVPIGLLDELHVNADLFVSTWALNESTAAAQQRVIERRWFSADGLLLAMHYGDPLEGLVRRTGARAIPVGAFMPAQQYLVR